MNNYLSLMNKKISLEFNGTILNSYKITQMMPTDRVIIGLEGNGKIVRCTVEWEKKDMGGEDIMDFDEKTLNELLTGVAFSPITPNLIFRVEGNKKSQKNLWNKN